MSYLLLHALSHSLTHIHRFNFIIILGVAFAPVADLTDSLCKEQSKKVRLNFWAQFHQRSTYSFYSRRSKSVKDTDGWTEFLCFGETRA
jgi:hypothetical protein